MLPVAIRPPTDFLIVVNHLAFLRLTSQCRNLANHAKLIGLGHYNDEQSREERHVLLSCELKIYQSSKGCENQLSLPDGHTLLLSSDHARYSSCKGHLRGNRLSVASGAAGEQ